MGDKTGLGDRMKLYESQFTSDKLIPRIPIIARIDGRAFHTFCKGLDKPYDQRMMETMQETTICLVESTNAVVGYTQSDEISLVFFNDNINGEVFFNGKVFKMTSVLASMATFWFNKYKEANLIDKLSIPAFFDCRVWNVPNKIEACNYLIWREQDATRNSIQSAGQANFSHKDMQGANTSMVQDMLMEQKGINWNDYPVDFKRGSYYKRRKYVHTLAQFSLPNEPVRRYEKGDRLKEDEFVRTSIQKMELPKLSSIENIEEVIFDDEYPITKGKVE